jgi:hypothetical protein
VLELREDSLGRHAFGQSRMAEVGIARLGVGISQDFVIELLLIERASVMQVLNAENIESSSYLAPRWLVRRALQ